MTVPALLRFSRFRSLRPQTGFLWLLAVVAGITALAVQHAWRKAGSPRTVSGHARIIDGDSLVVAGVEVRLWGIDAPNCRSAASATAGRCAADAKPIARSLPSPPASR